MGVVISPVATTAGRLVTYSKEKLLKSNPIQYNTNRKILKALLMPFCILIKTSGRENES
jgi:hypothetical protein